MTEESLFAAAIAIPNPAARAAYLDRACAGDADLRGRLAALVAAHLAPDPLLAPPDHTVSSPDQADTADPDGTRSRPADDDGAAGTVVGGRYKLLQRIGEGGMGEVWMADQTQPVRRRVAVKLIRAERGTSKAILARFAAERQAIALMDHPHIAKLLDAGATPDGRPYFVMELVKGVPLTGYCDAHRLSVPDRLALFAQVCSAVQHAHQKGVIHRDLKPSNVLVESHDGKPVPKVIDFGLAKAAGGVQLTEHTLFTGFGSVMGTPLYMAPEQATFNAVDVDTRADIYALGVVLYELLTGTTPLSRETVKKAALEEVLRLVREQDAPTPSSRLSANEAKPTVAANRQTEPARLGRLVRGELDWIVLKALAKDRDRRYDTAAGFAKDIERFLNREPVQAGPPTAGYRLRKFVQRNRGPVLAVGVVAAAVLLGFAGTGAGLVQADEKRREAERARADEAAQRKTVEEQKEQLEKQQGELKVRTQEAEEARRDADLELHDNQRVLLRAAWENGDTKRMKGVLDQMRPKAGRPDLRGFETHYLDRLAHAEVDRRPIELPSGVEAQSVSEFFAPGRLVYRAVRAANNHFLTVTATDLATGKPAAGFTPVSVRWASEEPGPLVYAVPGDPPRLWASGTMPYDPQAVPGYDGGTWSPQRDFRVWDARTGALLAQCERLLPDPELTRQGWKHCYPAMMYAGESADRNSTRVVTQLVKVTPGRDGGPAVVESRAQLHDFKTGNTILTLDPRPGVLFRAHFTFDDTHLVTTNQIKGPTGKTSYLVTVWDVATGRSVWQTAPDDEWRGFTRDGSVLAFGSGPDATGKEWRAKQANSLSGGYVSVTPTDGELTYFRSGDGSVVRPRSDSRLEVRDAGTGLLLDTLPGAGAPAVRASTPTRQWVGTGGGPVVTWDDNRRVSEYRPPRAEVARVPVGKDHRWQVSATTDGRPRFISAVYGAAKPAAGGGFVTSETKELLWFDPEAMQLRRVNLGDAPAGKRVVQHSEMEAAGRTLVVTEDGSAPGGAPGAPHLAYRLGVFDLETGRRRCVATLSELAPRPFDPAARPTSFTLSADGTRVAGIDPTGGRVVCLNTDAGDRVWEAPLPDAGCSRPPLFLPDRPRVVACDDAGTLHVFDTADGRLVKSVAGGPKMPKGFVGQEQAGLLAQRVTPDGRTLYFTSIDHRTLTLFDTTDWAVRHTLKTETGVWAEVGDGFAVVRSEEAAEAWDLFAGKAVGRFEWPKPGWGRVLNVRHCVFDRDGKRAFVLTDDAVRVFDVARGHEVLALPLSEERTVDYLPPGETIGRGHLSLNPAGTELTVVRFYRDRGAVLKRVFDARPLAADELARGRRLDALRPPEPKPPVPPTPPADQPPVTLSDFFDVAVRHQQTQRWKEAAEAYRKAIKLDPDYPPLHRRLAGVLQAAGDADADAAIAAYREAARLAPRDFVSRHKIGMILEQRGDHRGAVAALREAVAADTRSAADAGVEAFGPVGEEPTRLAIRNSLAYHLRECGDLAEAEAVFRDGLKLLDGDKELAVALTQWPRPGVVMGNFAVCLLRQNKAKEAEAECQTLVTRLAALIPKEEKPALPPGDLYHPAKQPMMHAAGAHSDIANELLWAGRHAEAVDWSDRAIGKWTDYRKRWPNDSEGAALQQAYWRKAVALNWLDKGTEAVAAIDESIKLTPDAEKPKQRTMRARYVAKSGDHAGAAKQVRELLKEPYTGIDPQWFHWDAALAFALNAKSVATDARLREEYAAEAIRLLKMSADAGFADVALLKKEKDLDPVRERADFMQLMADLEKRHPPKAGK